jgi:predicted transcriptional regulator
MQQFSNLEISEIKSRIDQIQQLLDSRGEAPPSPAAPIPHGSSAPTGDQSGLSPPELVDRIAFNIQMRRIRTSHFAGALRSGANWDMMLDLMLARAHGRLLSASDLATGADVPLSSGLRMIAALEQQGFVRRTIDEKDRRRSIVRLTDDGAERMMAYFDAVGCAWQDRQRRAA